MNHQDAMLEGKCPDCDNGILHHGPWTQQQMKEVADDYGMPAEDFTDCCDQCFIDFVCFGDAAYAQSLCPDHTLNTKKVVA